MGRVVGGANIQSGSNQEYGRAVGHAKRRLQSYLGSRHSSLCAQECLLTTRISTGSGAGEQLEMTIYEALKTKLGREPTNAELKADVQRIKEEALIEAATKGKLRHQRRR